MIGGPVQIRARWGGYTPEEGTWFASARGRFVYRVAAVRRIDPRQNRHRYAYALTCERWSPEDVPAEAAVQPWKWDRRKRRRT